MNPNIIKAALGLLSRTPLGQGFNAGQNYDPQQAATSPGYALGDFLGNPASPVGEVGGAIHGAVNAISQIPHLADSIHSMPMIAGAVGAIKNDAKPIVSTAEDMKNALADMPIELQKIAQDGTHKYSFIHNTEKAPAPAFNDRFGQKIEPAGKYMTLTNAENAQRFANLPNYETGTVQFQQPLVVDGSNGSRSWKEAISKQNGGKTGKGLTQELIKKGYDGIITMDNGHPSETIHFDRQLPDGAALNTLKKNR
jgi:hypothetical protein